MADSRRKEWDKKTNENRNEKALVCTFNLKIKEEVELYNKFLKIKNKYDTSVSQTLKNLIIEKAKSEE